MEVDDKMPQHEYYEYFGPDYNLHVAPSNMENKNSWLVLEEIRNKLIENLTKLQHAPSFHFQERPPDTELPEFALVYFVHLQEAHMMIKKPPHILVIHLKRFKYIEQLSRYKKLSYCVVSPLKLKLSNTMEDADSEYSLFAVVVHVGSGPNHGHYVSLVKSHDHMLFFDDENVEMIDDSAVQTFFGSAQEYSSNTYHEYILFYESLGANNRS